MSYFPPSVVTKDVVILSVVPSSTNLLTPVPISVPLLTLFCHTITCNVPVSFGKSFGTTCRSTETTWFSR